MSDRPQAEPETPSQVPPEQIQAEPQSTVEPIAEPSAPTQIAPEPGAAPVPAEPEPSVEPVVEPSDERETGSDQPGPAPVPTPPLETESTLALPPTTREVEPPAPSQPERPVPTGVPVPFAAPPTERNGGRFATKLIVGIVGGIVFVVGIVVALGVAMVMFTNSVVDKVEGTAETFIEDLAAEDWNGAYGQLCSDLRERPIEDFVDEWETWDADGAEVRQATPDGTAVVVELGNGSVIELEIAVEQDTQSLETSVCGWRDAN